MSDVNVVGAGLAGCEAANKLAALGHRVALFEMKPMRRSAAHTNDGFAELVCSNSFKATRLESAGGLLKAEMRLLDSLALGVADTCAVAAGGALAVDRDAFSRGMTAAIEKNPNITVVREEVLSIDTTTPTIVCTGPLTDGALAAELARLAGGFLSYYDAAAPIVLADSIDTEKVYAAARYDRGDADYLNCFFNKEQYEDFWRELTNARSAPLHDFDREPNLYEGCMPIEMLAKRGVDSPRFGPMRPVGLTDPATGRRPWAAVQLRKEDEPGAMYNIVGFQTNLAFGEQKRVFSMIPGLEHAEFARYGVMHRNSFLDSPRVLRETLSLKDHANVYIAGQLTGFEGYMESACCGLLAALFLDAALRENAPPRFPRTTMCGGLLGYIAAPNKDFQPMGANMGLLEPLEQPIKGKQQRYAALAARALEDMTAVLEGNELCES